MARIIDGKDMNLIGDKVKYYRKERNMSQQSLSERDLSPQASTATGRFVRRA